MIRHKAFKPTGTYTHKCKYLYIVARIVVVVKKTHNINLNRHQLKNLITIINLKISKNLWLHNLVFEESTLNLKNKVFYPHKNRLKCKILRKYESV